ncbi:PAS domain-containing protein [Methylobacterium sp. 17Sr1-1]|uniref:PAS domain-containing protein n=1 Tax=Methylobacterium sp. 17Sr1-1 TaxID=2202826 RepID=UPI0013A56FC9|nr:PAS domain-containing protein [Methylobacterium sp. 17Sr1-1]
MNASDLTFTSSDFLRLLDARGLTGSWCWVFATNTQVWSPGLFHLLGLQPHLSSPGYDLLRGMLHPEDRDMIETAAQVLQGDLRRERVVRVIRPDGTMRILSANSEVRYAPDGRPRSAMGTFLDVTDRESLRLTQTARQRQYLALVEQSRTLVFSHRIGWETQAYPSFSALLAPDDEELAADNLAAIVKEQRETTREIRLHALAHGLVHQGTTQFRMAGGIREPFRSVIVPVRNLAGEIVEWAGVTGPAGQSSGQAVSDGVRQGLEQMVRGRHLRAARGLLDWSMSALAEASGLSLSTVRRLEEDAEAQADRSRHKAVAALRGAGIRFLSLDDGTLAVARF